ncbi:MAG: phosphoribosyltransferase family protein [Actinomycetota bacterium]
MFTDRDDAGRRLADAMLGRVAGPVVVLAIPRGGAVVAQPVAAALGAPLDVVVPRKLGAPGNPELAIGAVAQGVRVLDDRLVRILGVDADYLSAEIARAEAEISRRTLTYRRVRQAPDLSGRTVVVVDDGVATGATAIAALRWARAAGAGRVLFAAPVGPPDALVRLGAECDEVVLLETPSGFGSVGEWYERFDQVSDDRVRSALDS